MSAPDPVSWKVVEHGWAVVGSDGSELGTVDQVVGDPSADIFNGLAVSPGILRAARYVPAERVGEIVEGRVKLDLAGDEFERLADYEQPPPTEELRAD